MILETEISFWAQVSMSERRDDFLITLINVMTFKKNKFKAAIV